MLSLKSSDSDVFQIEESAVICKSKTIATLVKAGWPGQPPFPLPETSTETLSKVIQYCNRHHALGQSSNTDLHEWDARFVDVGRYALLLDLITAADFLGMKSLLDLGCQAVADMIQGTSPKDTRFVTMSKPPQPPKRRRSRRQPVVGIGHKRNNSNQWPHMLCFPSK